MSNRRTKIIISTGQGRLHLIQSAIALKQLGVSVKVITGWIPSGIFSDRIINKMGNFIGRKNNLAAGIRKRTPKELDHSELKSCSFAEFLIQFLFKTTSLKLYSRSMASVIGWKAFGIQSKHFIKDADVFHVRSGAGQGGAISHARRAGMRILVDHSIAHPREMERQLAKANENSSEVHNKYKSLTPNSEFWQLVLKDCKDADCLLVNSEYVKWSFVKEGYPESKIRIAQLGVNPEFNMIKDSYKKLDQIKLVFTGGFGRRKGALLIIDALSMLEENKISYTLDVVGTVMNDISLPNWVREAEYITFHGHLPQDKMLPILLQSDIYIFPTYVEGAAQSVKEAMSVGLPVVTTMQSGAPIEHGINGIIVDDHNAIALFEAIRTLSEDEALRAKIGSNATDTIKETHTWLNYAVVVNNIYGELLLDGIKG